ncbi:hypothetical protein Tco_0825964, partial [Tanacetum coccineum]
FAPTIRNFLMNKEKLLELAKIPLNENCSAILLKKLPEKLGDPGKNGYIKNHKKTIKNGQARTREWKSVQKPEAKP